MTNIFAPPPRVVIMVVLHSSMTDYNKNAMQMAQILLMPFCGDYDGVTYFSERFLQVS